MAVFYASVVRDSLRDAADSPKPQRFVARSLAPFDGWNQTPTLADDRLDLTAQADEVDLVTQPGGECGARCRRPS